MKKFTSVILSLVLILSLLTVATPLAFASDYPWLYMSFEDENADYYAGDVVDLKFEMFREFNNEIYYVNVYDSENNLVASSEKQLSQYSSSSTWVKYTVTWDTKDEASGKYKIVTSSRFYSFYNWHDAPKSYTYWITLKDASLKPVTGWNIDENGWYYLDSTGDTLKNEWLCDNGLYYYLGEDKYMVTDWYLIDGSWYYFNASGVKQTGWLMLGNTWYYLNSEGIMQTGWQQLGYSWYYFNEGGAMQTGWLLLGDTWYYLSDSGNMLTGWLQLGNTWYYLNDNGAMLTGWQHIGYSWYYFNYGGVMQTGWLQIGDTWYCLSDSGAMLTGWHCLSNNWYYFDEYGSWVA